MTESEKKPDMTKKKDKSSGMSAAKAYEREQAANQATIAASTELVEFDQWWALRAEQLKQPAHVKAVMKADARGRGLSGSQTMEKWDWAARKYGLTF